MPLELHAASPDERLAAYRNVHDVWSGGLPLEQHVARRLASVQHNRADWYVGCLDGRVVASLAAYPLQFHVQGEIASGFSIGSVHTVAEHRGRGFAADLIRWVEATRRAAGAQLSLLYSDIACGYYARLGYLECPAWEGERTTAEPLITNGQSPRQLRLKPFTPEESLTELSRLYESYHGQKSLAVARSTEYWRFTLAKSPQDTFCSLLDSDGIRCGYVRLNMRDNTCRLHDFALESEAPELQLALLQQVLAFAAEQGAGSVSGWLPDWPVTRSDFHLRPRQQEITMVKSLDDNLSLDAAAIASAHAFCEIDHV